MTRLSAFLAFVVIALLGSLADVDAAHDSLSGRAGFAVPEYGADYLAIPVSLGGRGARVRICDRGGECITRTATDAGPALSEQRKGRVADLSFAMFRTLCECDPWTVGRIAVTVTAVHQDAAFTLPPTDTAP